MWGMKIPLDFSRNFIDVIKNVCNFVKLILHMNVGKAKLSEFNEDEDYLISLMYRPTFHF